MAKDSGRRFSPRRYSSLVHYIAAQSPGISTENLCWCLYKADMSAYGQFGRSLTGATYIKGETHPVPCHLGRSEMRERSNP